MADSAVESDEEHIHALNRKIAGPLKDVVSHCKKIVEVDGNIFKLEEEIRELRVQRRHLYEALDSVVRVE